jgi:antibiotic biosynthesis monooxygenase (ABM) superfamily enzyme
MARHILVVQTECEPGQEKVFNDWYDEVHVPDVLDVPGFVRGQRFEAVPGLRGELPDRRFLAIYEFETDDPAAALADLRQAMKTMQIDASLDMAKIIAFAYAAHAPALEAAP